MTFRTFAATVAATTLAFSGVALSAPPATAMEAVFDVPDVVFADEGCTDLAVTSNFTFTSSDAPTRDVLLSVLTPELEPLHTLRVGVSKNEQTRTDHMTLCVAADELVSGTYTVTGQVLTEGRVAARAVNDKWSTTFEVYVPPRVGTAAPNRAGTAMLRKVGKRGIRVTLTEGTFEQNWRVKVRRGKNYYFTTGSGTSVTRTFRWKTGRHTVKVFTDGQLVVKRTIRIR